MQQKLEVYASFLTETFLLFISFRPFMGEGRAEGEKAVELCNFFPFQLLRILG